MKTISQGKYEIFTTKADAIDKFMEIQGVCRENTSDESPIIFYCSEKGKIVISNPSSKNIESSNSTNLYGEVIEQDGKTYVTYYTAYNKSNNILKSFFIVISIIMAIVGIIFAIISVEKLPFLIFFVLFLAYLVFQLITNSKEEKFAPDDSEIMIKELKNRVDAVNLWNK